MQCIYVHCAKKKMSIMLTIQKNRIKRKIRFRSIIKDWLAQKKSQIKKSTYSNYEYTAKKYLLGEFGNCTLKDLQRYDYSKFTEELTRNLSAKTTKDILVKLREILEYINEEYDTNIKIKNIRLPKIEVEPVAILSDKEKKRILNNCIEEKTLLAIGILIAFNTGMRIGEICALQWKNVDLSKREIRVRKTAQRIYNEGCKKTKVIIDDPKSKSSVRNIPISSKLYKYLAKEKGKYNDEDFLLTGTTYVMEPRNYENYFKKKLKECKIKNNYHFHILRHTFATACINTGMDVKTLSEIMGHSTSKMTTRYMHPSDEIKAKYLEKI